ncbi:MAG: hypothetical protein K2K56_10795 [Lachnospiraceae bacterium]|nr:hypothetical protein [Lachnospiraceae bacterium]
MSLEDDSPESECLKRLQQHEVRASAYYYIMSPTVANDYPWVLAGISQLPCEGILFMVNEYNKIDSYLISEEPFVSKLNR